MTLLIQPFFSRLLALVLVILIGACSQTPELQVTQESERSWDRRQQQLVNIDEWEIHARIAILLEDKVYPLVINWVRQQERSLMIMEAPFGQGVIRLQSNTSTNKNEQFKLTLVDGRVHLGPTPEVLLFNLLGWSIPVSGLKSWIKGLPQSNVDSNYEIYGSGRLKSLQQNGWLINYLDYFSEQEQPQQLPKRLYLKHKNMGIKMAIERWEKFEVSVESESIFPNFD
jgi:outer membrane lipoprotein LolB